MTRWTLPALLLLAAWPAARADLRPPPRPAAPGLRAGPQDVKLVVEIDDKAKQPRLLVPRNLLVNPGGAVPGARPGRAGASLPTAAAGLALALGLMSGGVWLARRGGRRALAAAAGALVLLGLGGVLWADIPAGPRPRPKPVRAPEVVGLPAGVQLSGKLTLEIVPRGDSLKLVVSKSMLTSPRSVKLKHSAEE
jgi:hypothetical protein